MNFKLSGCMLVFAAAVASAVGISIAAEPTPMLLWPNGAPGAKGESGKRQTKTDAVFRAGRSGNRHCDYRVPRRWVWSFVAGSRRLGGCPSG